MLEVGYVLHGRYQIESVLGQGGMGYVYLALDTTLGGKKVAVKEMAVNINNSEHRAMAIDQFKKEATLLARLEHHSLVDVTDYFEEANNAYLVMAYVEGRTLEDILAHNQGFLSLDMVLEWAVQLCEVLEYLHERPEPVLFRDLKPANIMLDARGHIRLIDFGIARVLDPQSKTSTFLKGAGTAEFAPVEQFGGSSTDVRSDVYSFGGTLYNLLTRQLPPVSVALMFGEEHLQPPSSINAAVSAEAEAIILRAMALRKEDRYQSVSEMHEALLSLMRPQRAGVVAAPPSPAGAPTVLPLKARSTADMPLTRADPPAPRRAGWPMAAVVMLVLLAGAAVGLAHQWHAASAAASGASLIVASDPDKASVKLDDALLGLTPISVPLAPGQHRLNLDKNGRVPVTVKVMVPEGRVESESDGVRSSVNKNVYSVEVSLHQQHGVMRLEVQPDKVNVLVDGESRGQITSGQSLTVGAGTHQVTLQAAGYRPLTKTVQVEWNQIVPVAAKLSATLAALRVESKPSGASVLLDGQAQIGLTPLTLNVSPQKHMVTVEKDGFTSVTKAVLPGLGKKNLLSAQLHREVATTTIVEIPAPPMPPRETTPPPQAPPPGDPPKSNGDWLSEFPPPAREWAEKLGGALDHVREHPDHKDNAVNKFCSRWREQNLQPIPPKRQALNDLFDRAIGMTPQEYQENKAGLVRGIMAIHGKKGQEPQE